MNLNTEKKNVHSSIEDTLLNSSLPVFDMLLGHLSGEPFICAVLI